jgi:peroxiredoxin Q/BCP
MDAAQWDRRHAGTGLLWTAEPNPIVIEQLAGLPPGRALDLACGVGRNAIWLATQGWRVTGLDFSAVAIHKARELSRRFDVTPDWIQADVLEWMPPPQSYDLVTICYLHLPPAARRGVLHRAVDALVPGGTLLVLGHDRATPASRSSGPTDPDNPCDADGLLLDADALLTELADGPPLRISRAGRIPYLPGTASRQEIMIDTLLVGVRSDPASTQAALLGPATGTTTGDQPASTSLSVSVGGFVVVHRMPGVAELRRLRTAGGLPDPGPEAAADALDGSLAGLCVEAVDEPGRAVGCGRIVGDGRTFLVIMDVAIDPIVFADADTDADIDLSELIINELCRWAAGQVDPAAFVGVATVAGVEPLGIRSIAEPAEPRPRMGEGTGLRPGRRRTTFPSMTETAVRLTSGDTAPDFTLPDATGTQVSLSSYRGRRVVVYFYPAASTPGCTKQACDFRDSLAQLNGAGIDVLGVSPDAPVKLAAFRDTENLTFPLLSDPERTVLAAYGAYGEKTLYGKKTVGVIRSTFVVDADGKIEKAMYNVRATGHVAALIRGLGLPD